MIWVNRRRILGGGCRHYAMGEVRDEQSVAEVYGMFPWKGRLYAGSMYMLRLRVLGTGQ